MDGSERLVTLTRGGIAESVHFGHVAIWQKSSGLIAAWGQPETQILPRSSCKMIQALPLVESGAADAYGLQSKQLALACASHRGLQAHSQTVMSWLDHLGLSETDLRCGAHNPTDPDAHADLIRSAKSCDQTHNNCSGKHAGFLTLNQKLGGGKDYVSVDHPVQCEVKLCFEELTDCTSPGFGIDGCSAPNFITTLAALARAMSEFAAAAQIGSVRGKAMLRLTHAMMEFPEMVSGPGAACTELMRAMAGRAAVKTGAEGVYVAIVPESEIGVAVKIVDGAGRAAEATISAILVSLSVLDGNARIARQLRHGPLINRRSLPVGEIVVEPSLADWRL